MMGEQTLEEYRDEERRQYSEQAELYKYYIMGCMQCTVDSSLSTNAKTTEDQF